MTDILNDKKFRDKETLFISYEIMSQSLLYLNYKEHFNLIRDIFKAAEIIVFLRYQSDFILSSYRQLLHNKRTTVSIKKFLNFRNGEFGSANEPNISSININKINYHELLGDYINYYGRKNVHIYFYEYFGKETVNSLFRILQVDVPENINFKKPINKGFSALAIQLTILKEKILQYLKIRPNNNNPQPINMFNMPLNTARKKKNIIFIFFLILYKIYWNLLRASRAPLGSWRGFVQKIFDRIIYIDWNILKSAGIDILLDNKFKSDNLKLLEFIDRKDIPKKYLE